MTYNREATVTTHGGRTEISMRADGSYAVASHGRDVAVTQGKPVRLGGDEQVTLNADKSLTVLETNGTGGSIGTTLCSNGSGVDVSSTAHGVDLGGYLVNRTDGEPAAAQTAGTSGFGGWQAGLTYENGRDGTAIGGFDPSTLDDRPADVAFA